MRKILSTLILAAACAAATASPDRAPFEVQGVLEQQKQIRTEVETGKGAYGGLDANARRELATRQERLFKLLEGRRYEDLSESEREGAHGDLAWIAQAARSGEEKLVCERIRPIGSNRVERVCKTAAQRRAEQEARNQNVEMLRQQGRPTM
ncbi:hypothetical protein [Lysobacter sp. CA196]|uniref:hypothetical protein n=1 Tax=Lysobacter sp. CA196 TaxID=3455606 RepID=UPI003F8D3240